jgi:hypothetical protein
MSAQPRCVRREASRKSKQWRAMVKIAGKPVDLGRWATRVEGLAAYKAVRKLFPINPPGRPKKQPAGPTLEDYPEQLELFPPDLLQTIGPR